MTYGGSVAEAASGRCRSLARSSCSPHPGVANYYPPYHICMSGPGQARTLPCNTYRRRRPAARDEQHGAIEHRHASAGCYSPCYVAWEGSSCATETVPVGLKEASLDSNFKRTYACEEGVRGHYANRETAIRKGRLQTASRRNRRNRYHFNL